MKLKVAIFASIGLLVAVPILLIYSGTYNVAASEPHFGPVASVLKTIQLNSVRAHASTIIVPDPSEIVNEAAGLHHFAAMCVGCHGAPGIEPNEIGRGLYPAPPDLSESVKELSKGELYWIVKNGIKMTGMPGFGTTHSDGELWGIVAVLQRLPDLTARDYQTMLSAMEEGHSGHAHGRAGDGEPPGPSTSTAPEPAPSSVEVIPHGHDAAHIHADEKPHHHP